MTESESIAWLLERMEDALMERPSGTSNERNGRNSVLLKPGPWWNSPAFKEISRCLDLMRNQARQQSVTYAPGKTCSLGCARWHVIAWYVSTDTRTTMTWKDRLDDKGRPRRGKKGQRLGEYKREPEVCRHRDARQDRAEAGVAWIATQFKAWDNTKLAIERWQDKIAAS